MSEIPQDPGREPRRRQWNRAGPGDDAEVTGTIYDVGPADGPPPIGIERVRIEPMGREGLEPLAAELLDLLAWAAKEVRDG